MAVGDQITSSDVCSLYRRINALENEWTWTYDTGVTAIWGHCAYDLAGGTVFYGVKDNGIKSNNLTLTSESSVISDGTSSTTVDTSSTSVPIYLGYSADDDKLYIASRGSGSTTGVQCFDGDGTHNWTNRSLPSSSVPDYGIVALPNDECVCVVYDYSVTGTATSTSSGKLIDTGATFTKSAYVGQTVTNTTDSTTATIDSVDSDTQLTIDTDIFISGEDWKLSGDYLVHFDSSGNDTLFCDAPPEQFGVLRSLYPYTASQVALNLSGGSKSCIIYDEDGSELSDHSFQRTLTGTEGDFGANYTASVNGFRLATGEQGSYWNTGSISIYSGGYKIADHVDPAPSVLIPGFMDSDFNLFYGITQNVNGTLGRWVVDSPTQTTWYRYPRPGATTGKVSLGTPDLGDSVPSLTALQNYRVHYNNLDDPRTALESIAADYKGPTADGTTTGTTANKLVDSGASFTSTVHTTSVVYNTTDSTSANVTTVDSDTQLTLDSDIFTSGEDYVIVTPFVATGSNPDNIFTIVFGSSYTDWPSGTVTYNDRLTFEHWDEIDQVVTHLERSERE